MTTARTALATHGRLPALLSIALTAVVMAPACSKDSGAPAEGKATGASATTAATDEAKTPEAPKKPSVRTKLEDYRPLLDEAARAELDAGGLFIDLGTADQHKFTRGGWRTGWGESKQEDGLSLSAGDDRRLHLDVLTSEPAAEVAVRARSAVDGQAATVWVDGERQGDIWLKPEWTVMRVPVAEGALAAGRHNVQLTFTKSGTPRAEIDWVWLANEVDAEPPSASVRVLPLRIGSQPKRALIAPTTRTYSFYMQPPAGASLVFDYASDVGASFEVRAQADGGAAESLFTATGGESWEEAQVDLGAFADKAIRLDLVATGAEGRSGWGEPALMVAPGNSDKPALKTAAPGTPKNVVVILIDTVRADSFAAIRPDNKVVTPAFDAFADKATVFTNAYNNENWTKPSVASLLSGLYPSTHDTKKDESSLPKEVEILSQRLSKQGFATAGFVANGYVSEKFGFEKGWDAFTNYIRENKSSEAEYVYGDALAWLGEREKAADGKPFFLYIQTIDPHVTYKVERPFTQHYYAEDYGGPLGPTIDALELQDLSTGKKQASDKDLAWLRAMYRGEVTYHDEHMGKFFEQLQTMGRMDDTLIVITNDHGEELGDHGKFGHGHTLFDELLRAPLLMYFPGMFPEGGRVDEIVETVDIAPTIVEVLGLEPMSNADGTSLLPLVQGKPIQRPTYAISEFLDGRRAVRVGDWKFMRSSSTWANLHNVADDFHEENDRSEDALIARRMCEVHLGEGLATPDKSKRQQDITIRRKFKAGEADIDPAMRKQLEALGYFGE
ncbi:sulfatase [Haliangium ochraceum DSM 14365]|uniref:Sulfatase n=1 Tax=Haliangium ochraceum (strain DSM 14365 / JCM 11303 / SMP-2) TaxID=502025 RepID=D0LHZ8_HALO1|nr:sulfatase [Haliangium ochraceum DSM 14365]